MVIEATVCHIIGEDKLLLKKADRGFSVGKWNGAGGKIENGETAEEGAVREVFEETGLTVSDLFYHGILRFFMDGTDELFMRGHLFSTKNFSGDAKSSEEGEVRWFEINKLPFDDMWADDPFWFDLMLNGKKFDADFYYDKENKKILRHEIRLKE